MYRLTKRRIILAAGFGLAGVAILGLAAAFLERPRFGLWLPFALAFAVLEWRTVEVNDRWYMSSSVMLALTAGVVFAITGADATLGMPMVAAAGLLTPADIRERRWFQPSVNFGQLVISAAAAGAVLDLLLGGVPAALSVQHMPQIAVAGGLAALVYTFLNNLQVRLIVRLVYTRRQVNPWSHLTTLFGSQAVMGFIGGLLGATLLLVEPGVIPLVGAVYVIGHMSLASFSDLREAHLATLRGMVKALEAKDLYTRGHTERVAYFCRLIGEQLGFSGTRLERLRWAALIHDVGKLAVPGRLLSKQGKLEGGERVQMQRHVHVVEDILAEVEFLRPMVDIASAHHSRFDGGGYGGTGHRHGETPSLDTCILTAADAFDAMTSSRSYRMALSQRWALEELRRHAGTQFHPEVVEALDQALRKVGETYGKPHMDSEEAARRLAEQQEQALLYG